MSAVLKNQFRLQRLLEMREKEVDARKKELAAERERVGLAQTALDAAERELIRLERLWVDSAMQGMSAWLALDFQHSFRAQAEVIRESSDALERRRAQESVCRAHLEHAAARLKALDKLRERARQRADSEERRQAQIELDEFAAFAVAGGAR